MKTQTLQGELSAPPAAPKCLPEKLTAHEDRTLGPRCDTILARAYPAGDLRRAYFRLLGRALALRLPHHRASDDAEDLLSETLVEGYRCFGQFRGDTAFARWMYRIMTTTRIDMVRRSSRRKTESLDAGIGEEGGEAIRDIPDRGSDPARIVLDPMLSEPVQQALNALSEEFRQVVILADMEDMDYADVSRVLNVPIGTVRSRLHRGRSQLRKALAAYVEDPSL